MPPPDDPYLEIGPFATQFGRALSDAETPVATRLLQVVSGWIYNHAPAPVRQVDAEQVVFEVVRDALTYGPYERLSSFDNTTAHRTESGTFDYAASVLDDYLTDKHKRLLGIPLKAGPAYSFPVCDY